MVSRFIPRTLEERLTNFFSSANFIAPALLLRLFGDEGEVVFSDGEDAAVIQAFEEAGDLVMKTWSETLGWQEISIEDAMAPGDPNTLELSPMTLLPEGGDENGVRVEIASQEIFDTPGSYFAPGDRVVINPGAPNEEIRTVQALGSLVFAQGLKFDHLSGSMVASLGPDTTDRDGDHLTGFEEVALGTNPDQPDTDFDGLPDGVEVANGFDPLDPTSGLEVSFSGWPAAGDSITVSWHGHEGNIYAIEYSLSLLEDDWQELGRATGTAGLQQSYLVPIPAEAERGFVRVRYLQSP